MRVDDHGQITIPKDLQERFGLHPQSEVELVEQDGQLVLRKKRALQKTRLAGWVGYLEGQPDDVDTFIEEIRGR